jgi:hypothetical protein
MAMRRGEGDKEEADGDEEDTEDEEDVTEIEDGVFATTAKPAHSLNYTDVEDVLLVRAWSQVGMNAVTDDTDQTGKRYWQRIEDKYCKLKPKTGMLSSRSYRSLQGRWELMKPACACWIAAMDQVSSAPPSDCIESDYVSTFNISFLLHA